MIRALYRTSQFCVIAIVLAVVPASVRSADSHGPTFWRALKQQDFKLAPGTAVFPLALEATDLLGSTDGELRDGIAYEALASWIYRDPLLSPDELNRLRVVLTANAQRGLGKGEDDSLFLRSFSDLVLSVLAAQDLRSSFLDSAAFNALLELALRSMQEERDLRGYVVGKGWGHATAHVADLLKFLARNPRLRPEQQTLIVTAVARRLQTAGQVFTWGEDARLAAALNSVARRADADPTPFNNWFKEIQNEHAAVWSGTLDPALYVRERAQLNTLSELTAGLEADVTPGGTQEIRAALRKLRSETR